MDMSRGRGRLVVVAVTAAVIGGVLGPPIVRAATKAVTIKGAGNKAKVTNRGALSVDTEAQENFGALDTNAFTLPGGVLPIEVGASGVVASDTGFLTNVVVDAPTAAGEVTVTLTDNFGEIWQGTVQSGGHLNDVLQNGIVWSGNLTVTVSPSGQADVFLYGQAFGSGASSEREDARDEVRLRRG